MENIRENVILRGTDPLGSVISVISLGSMASWMSSKAVCGRLERFG
jgi:hypothetical protein